MMPTQPHRDPEIAPSQRKLKSLAKLQSLAAKFSAGSDYNLQDYIITGVTLDRARQDLSGISGSLADTVIAERTR